MIINLKKSFAGNQKLRNFDGGEKVIVRNYRGEEKWKTAEIVRTTEVQPEMTASTGQPEYRQVGARNDISERRYPERQRNKPKRLIEEM